MSTILLLAVLLLAPWKPECTSSVLNMGIAYHEYPCHDSIGEVAGWVGADNRIHLCAGPGLRTDWLLLHESQHLLARLYLNEQSADDWDNFVTVAMVSLYVGEYTREERIFASNMSHSGGQELHAELPWIIQGNIPLSLQPWYPWFDLSGASLVKAKHAS